MYPRLPQSLSHLLLQIWHTIWKVPIRTTSRDGCNTPRWVHPDDVRAIRLYHANGYTITALSKRFKLGRQCVSAIVHRRTHVGVTQADNDSLPPLSSVTVNTPQPPRSVDVQDAVAKLGAQRRR